jgi:hypothetical protein
MAMSTGSAWSLGGSILTFVFPMILFLVVATALFVAYTKPSVVPGHDEHAGARPIGFTPVVRMPARDQAGSPPAGSHHPAGPGEGGVPAAGAGEAAAPDHPAGRTGNPEGAE